VTARPALRLVRPERTGWRDAALSLRHRLWGFDCPMQDIDWLVAEYDRMCPVAIIEWMHERAPGVDPRRTWPVKWAVLRALADRRPPLPAFAVRYAADLSWWRVLALNAAARGHVARCTQYTERGFVRLLYRLRGRPLPDDLRFAPDGRLIAAAPEMPWTTTTRAGAG
jgi:hypothetical protein